MDNKKIWKYIEKFRDSRFFNDVITQGYVAKWGGIHIQAFLEEPDDEFANDLQDFLIDNTMLEPRTVRPFIRNNAPKRLKATCELFYSEDIQLEDFIDEFLALDQCGIFIASYMLSLASEGEYIIYHKIIYDALIDLFPFFKNHLMPVSDGPTYWYFHLLCEIIIQSYKFTSVQELHEFLWHGKDTDWTFVEK